MKQLERQVRRLTAELAAAQARGPLNRIIFLTSNRLPSPPYHTHDS